MARSLGQKNLTRYPEVLGSPGGKFSPELLKAVLRKAVIVARKDTSHPIGKKNRWLAKKEYHFNLANPAIKLLFPPKFPVRLTRLLTLVFMMQR